MTDSTCPDCAASATQVWHGFTHGCQGCAARALARGHHFRRCRDAGMLDRHYRAALALFGVTHEQVKAAAQADKGHAA